MRKFKLFFYPIYLVAIFVVLYYSIDILNNMDAYKEKLDMTFAMRQLPRYLMLSFIVLCVLMLIELVAENFHIINLKRKARNAEKEVLRLKARLYDESQDAPSTSIGMVDEDDMGNEEDENDEDEYKDDRL